MRHAVTLIILTALSGCGLIPVYEPYSFQTSGSASSNKAVVWGLHDKEFILFKKINGKQLPSRNGAGVPLSVELEPGAYELEILYINPLGAFDTTKAVKITVDKGHTYTVNANMIAGKRDAEIKIEDLGTSKKCHFEQYHKINGAAHRICN
ncbi:hypothetical protein [Cellvibrio sp. pealriver]|uniref:hypothetical protein n=1 Tax=Cellvibrio sp. pealriver TaxID=1622269 RepID=UPI00066FE309|nr:hypothetical protein [Cellvibrio sp. pealriver]